MRSALFIASAAALLLAGCNTSTSSSGNSQASDQAANISNKVLQSQVMEALNDAPTNGLTKDLFLKEPLPSDPAQRRQVLLNAIASYASALANGKVDPTKLYTVYTVPRSHVDVSGLGQALSQHRLREWLATLPPQTEEYRALSKAFVQLVQNSPDLPDTAIAGGKILKPGGRDPRIPAIVRNLQELGYLAQQRAGQMQQSGSALAATGYSPEVVQAVQHFQADMGVTPNGMIGPDTIKALNQSPRDRARTLAVAMERLRWLDRNPPATRIDVNTAASILDYWRDGQLADERRVVNGQPGWETPQLGAPMFQLVANPTWTVPDSIAQQEIAQKSSAWLAQNDFTQKNGHWVQGSGPKNSLGIVKFDMKDDQAIYLHDTPSKALFQLDDRHRSHGCIRVQDALGFAHMIAQADGIDEKFSEAMASGSETFILLNHRIPVRLMYHTAYLGGDGKLHYAMDVYAWDEDVAAALGYSKLVRPTQQQKARDIGP